MKAIVYTSNTGFTARYAAMLSEKTALPVYELEKAVKELEKGTEVIYLGWLFAGSIKGYKKAADNFSIAAVGGVGLCDTGCLLEEVRRAIKLPESIPLFTMQGGINKKALRGINKSMINVLIKFMAAKKKPSEADKRMLWLLENDGDYVSEENISTLLEWFEINKQH